MHPKTIKICAEVSKALDYYPTAQTLENIVGKKIDAIINPPKPEMKVIPDADSDKSDPPLGLDLQAVKDRYKNITGKKPGPKWDVATIIAKQAAWAEDNKK